MSIDPKKTVGEIIRELNASKTKRTRIQKVAIALAVKRRGGNG